MKLSHAKQYLTRRLKPAKTNHRSLKPRSTKFGFDRGTPIDRYYIEQFLSQNKESIKGTVLEIADNTYSKKFGQCIKKSEILHATKDNPLATIIGDLSSPKTLPSEIADCFICTQTYNFIYDYKSAVKSSYQLLKKNGVLLATVAGLCPISKYDMDRWGDYWRFTTKSVDCVFGEFFGENNVEVMSFGNVLSAKSFLDGLSAQELTKKELDYSDPLYQVLIAVKAIKK